jgi:hypothetical protein
VVRESSEALEAIKAEIGSLLFSAEYQQRPTPRGGAMIKRNWVRRYSERPQPRLFLRSPSRSRRISPSRTKETQLEAARNPTRAPVLIQAEKLRAAHEAALAGRQLT